MTTFACLFLRLTRADARVFLPLRIARRSVVLRVASLPLALQDTVIRLPPPLVLQLSLTATFGFGTGVGFGVGTAVTVGVGTGVGFGRGPGSGRGGAIATCAG